ncbi:MAG: hypothetical protein HY749_03215 [Gammaproteobacteria bacterium]|nr:hypothetical protein [Gammaproteobacteria bacterium]MBI5618020.1 hypothetical protein [Gammaproteobacteria bacterium]
MRLPAPNTPSEFVLGGCAVAILLARTALARIVRSNYPDLHAELTLGSSRLGWSLPYRLREPANYARLSLGTRFLANVTIVLDFVLSAMSVVVVFLVR